MSYRSLITYICLLGFSGSLIAMDAPLRPVANSQNAVKNQLNKGKELALILNTIYEVTYGIAGDFRKSLQELQKSKPKAAIKLKLSNRIDTLNDLIEMLPNSLAKLKQALIAFGKIAVAYDKASNSALLSNFITLYQEANELLCTTIENLDSLKAECILCTDDKNLTDFMTLSCGHEYCKECLSQHAQIAIQGNKIPCCPTPTCKKPFEYEEIGQLINSQHELNQINDIQFKEWLVKQNVKQCQTVNCPGSFICERTDQFTHKCTECKKEYCGQCLFPHDALTTCAQAKADRDLASNADAANKASELWKQQNTKACPRCKTSVEKNGGCNHMVCRKCRYEFCWNCLKDWNNHQYCRADRNQSAQQAQNTPQEQMTPANEHLFFARDPRGFVNRVLNGQLRKYNFAERFLRLSCQQQTEWTTRVTEFVNNNPMIDATFLDRVLFWLRELERLEPFAAHIYSFAQFEGLNKGVIHYTRPMNYEHSQQFAHFVVMQNPNDMILTDGHNFKTSLSQEQFQAALDRASAHFRNHQFEQPLAQAPQTPRVIPAQAPQARIQPNNNQLFNPFDWMAQAPPALVQQMQPQPAQNRARTTSTATFTFRAPFLDIARFANSLTMRHFAMRHVGNGSGNLNINTQALGNHMFTITLTSNILNAIELNGIFMATLREFGFGN